MIVGMTIGDKKIVSKIPFTLLPDFQNQRLTIVPSTQAITTLMQAIFTLKIKELRNSVLAKALPNHLSVNPRGGKITLFVSLKAVQITTQRGQSKNIYTRVLNTFPAILVKFILFPLSAKLISQYSGRTFRPFFTVNIIQFS